MSATLFRLNIKNNSVLLLIFCCVLCLYLGEIIYIFDPTSSQAMNEMLDMMPADLMAAFGYDQIGSTLTNFLAGFYYGFLVFAFPMVYYIILSNRLVCKLVDNGAFCYLLQTPASRRKIIFTQGVYLLSSIALLFLVVYVMGTYMAGVLFPGLLDVAAFTRLHVSTTLLTMALAMVCFFYSCLFNETRYSLAFGAGIPLAFLLLNMIGGVSDDTEIFKDLSLFSLLDATSIVENGNTTGINILFLFMIVILFAASVLVFDKKRLPL